MQSTIGQKKRRVDSNPGKMPKERKAFSAEPKDLWMLSKKMSKQKLLKEKIYFNKHNIVVFTAFKVKLNESNLNMFYVYLFFE
jgi:hypothetical protein